MQGGRDVHKGGVAGFGSGEGQSAGAATRHRVKIFNHHADQEVEVEVPEDRCATFPDTWIPSPMQPHAATFTCN